MYFTFRPLDEKIMDLVHCEKLPLFVGLMSFVNKIDNTTSYFALSKVCFLSIE